VEPFSSRPDDEGYFEKDGVFRACGQLSIIDLEKGNQPISNEDSKVWIVFNGEIYNYLELRPLLEKKDIFSRRIPTQR
jgi:asparagine synthase (glutamine-hydrolysing)